MLDFLELQFHILNCVCLAHQLGLSGAALQTRSIFIYSFIMKVLFLLEALQNQQKPAKLWEENLKYGRPLCLWTWAYMQLLDWADLGAGLVKIPSFWYYKSAIYVIVSLWQNLLLLLYSLFWLALCSSSLAIDSMGRLGVGTLQQAGRKRERSIF